MQAEHLYGPPRYKTRLRLVLLNTITRHYFSYWSIVYPLFYSYNKWGGKVIKPFLIPQKSIAKRLRITTVPKNSHIQQTPFVYQTYQRRISSRTIVRQRSWQCGVNTCKDSCKKRGTEGDYYNHKKICESCFLDMSRWRFLVVLKIIRDKRLILRNVCERWSGFLLQPFWKENIKIHGSMLVLSL